MNKKLSWIEKDRLLSIPICVVKEEKISSRRSQKLREDNCTNGWAQLQDLRMNGGVQAVRLKVYDGGLDERKGYEEDTTD